LRLAMGKGRKNGGKRESNVRYGKRLCGTLERMSTPRVGDATQPQDAPCEFHALHFFSCSRLLRNR
jgi:hypothetical protein